MKKATKKIPSKAARNKAAKNLEPNAAAVAKVRGGFYAEEHGAAPTEKYLQVDLSSVLVASRNP